MGTIYDLDPWWPIGLLVVVGVAFTLIVGGMLLWQRRRHRTRQLHLRFGPEYDRTVRRLGARRRAERELRERAARRDRMSLRTVPPDEAAALLARWEEAQLGFLDGPWSAVRAAEVLLDEAARARGYPDADPETRLQDLAEDHSAAVERYRATAREHTRAPAVVPGADGEPDVLRQRVLAARALAEELVEGVPVEPSLATLGAADGNVRGRPQLAPDPEDASRSEVQPRFEVATRSEVQPRPEVATRSADGQRPGRVEVTPVAGPSGSVDGRPTAGR